MRQIQVGDKVAYSVQWLRSTGQVAGDAGHARGTVTEIHYLLQDLTLAQVKWNCDMPERVNVKNLAIVGHNSKFCAVLLALLAFSGTAYAGQRAVNAYHTSKISTTTVLVSCNDERVPTVARLENTTAIVVTCRLQ